MPIRIAGPDDLSAIQDVAVASRLFSPEEVDWVVPTLGSDAYFWWVFEHEGVIRGAVMVAAEAHGDRVYNALFLAVAEASHRMGIGRRLMLALEAHLRAQGSDVARILLVETSSTPPQAAARAFYRAMGFTEEARIRGFYGVDDDKVVFWKQLSATG